MLDVGCEGKKKHPTYELAEKRAKKARRMDRKVRVYRCRTCGSWHTGYTERVPRYRPRREEDHNNPHKLMCQDWA